MKDEGGEKRKGYNWGKEGVKKCSYAGKKKTLQTLERREVIQE